MHPANVCTRTHARASAHARTRTHARKSTRALTGTCAHTHARGVERRDSRCTPKVPDSTISGQRTFANSFRSRSFSRLIDSVCLCVPTRAHLRRTAHEPNADRTKRSEAKRESPPSLGTFADRIDRCARTACGGAADGGAADRWGGTSISAGVKHKQRANRKRAGTNGQGAAALGQPIVGLGVGERERILRKGIGKL
jgi:hypothetical protein